MLIIRSVFRLLLIILFIYNTKSQIQNNITDSLNSFAINLLRTTITEGGGSLNVALSPYTIWTLLAIITEGAGGNTARQLERTLNIPQNKEQFRNLFQRLSSSLLEISDGVTFDISNAIFTTTQQNLKTPFQELTKNYYNVDIKPTDFQNTYTALNSINSYIARATKNKITNFIIEDDLIDAQILMTSAMYFKGDWKTPFNRSETFQDTFYDENQNKIAIVNMMHRVGSFPFARIEEIKSFALELPYGRGGKVSMVVLLPFKGETVNSVLKLLVTIPFHELNRLLEKAEQMYGDEDVQVDLPRFQVKSDLNLHIVLDKMGIKDIFDQEKADLLGIFPHYLFVSKLLQRAEIDVNEEGTVATAAAGAAFTYKSPPPKFHANKPFLYFIVDKPTRAILFAGKISNPNTF